VNVCLLVTGLGAGRVPGALLEHLGALDEGLRVTVALTEPGPLATDDPRLARASVVTVADAVASGGFDVALAVGWRSAVSLFRVPASRYALYLAELEHRAFGPGDPEAIPAALALDLPVDFVVEGRWLADEVSALRPEARVRIVRPGVRPAAGSTSPSAAGRLRVLPEGPAAEAALAAMSEPHDVAGAVADADVVLMLSTNDGVLGTPLAGFASGATAIVTPVPGHDELVRHRVNGLVADPDDERGAARWLDVLARDAQLLASLREGAARTAGAWPSVEAAAADFRGVLEELVRDEPPADVRWPVRLMEDAVGRTTVLREHMRSLDEAVVRARESAAEAQALVRVVRAPVVRGKARLRGLATKPALKPLRWLWRLLRG
jgi:hypothetical protein